MFSLKAYYKEEISIFSHIYPSLIGKSSLDMVATIEEGIR
jgi:hypothetical protein